MACSGAHCTSHSTGTDTCSGHRAACSTNRPVTVSAGFGILGNTISNSDVAALKAAIDAEVARYRQHAKFTSFSASSAVVGSGVPIATTHVNNFEAVVKNINDVSDGGSSAGTILAQYTVGNSINATNWSGLKAKYDIMRQDCICNSDCSCNAVCTCHNDCGCNYSDKRLKENIKFLGNKNGLNIYSWTYVWNKTKIYVGVIAQELLGTQYSNALTKDKHGFYKVNYSKLPI